jgi:hypothetical protein
MVVAYCTILTLINIINFNNYINFEIFDVVAFHHVKNLKMEYIYFLEKLI